MYNLEKKKDFHFMLTLRYTYISNSLFLQVLGDVVLVLLLNSSLLVVGVSADIVQHMNDLNICTIYV